MLSEILGVVLSVALTMVLAWPLGWYLVKVFRGEPVWSDIFAPIERFIFKISGIDAERSMDWKENLRALLAVNFPFFLLSFLLLAFQEFQPFWNPAGFGAWEPTLAFNTAVSFTTNTNLQHYSGETGASYLTQLWVMCWLQFVSAGTGIAACILLFNGISRKSVTKLGNFYQLMLKSCTRVLLPLSIVLAFILMWNGTPAHFRGPQEVVTLEGDTVQVAAGPVAPMVAIKQLGTNGGGYFGPNSTHPFENPNYLTNIFEIVALALLPMALVFAFGMYLQRLRLAWLIFGVMSFFYLSFLTGAIVFETGGNPQISNLGLAPGQANLEGKEWRFGAASSALWAVTTTSTSNGSVNSMHDSHMPLSGGIYLFDMFVNAIYGGVGVGFLNFFLFMIVAVFLSGLMVGRTPEFLGKKVEAREIKIAALIVILHPLLILTGTAIATFTAAQQPDIGWLANPGYHGFSEMLYEFTSAAANNGSGFEGLGDNTPFWNIATGIVMLLARFLPIIGPLAIIGSLAAKKPAPETAGSLRLDTPAFGAVLVSVILIVAALSFFPALALGPVAEFLQLQF